jgi:hypothetical protein
MDYRKGDAQKERIEDTRGRVGDKERCEETELMRSVTGSSIGKDELPINKCTLYRLISAILQVRHCIAKYRVNHVAS